MKGNFVQSIVRIAVVTLATAALICTLVAMTPVSAQSTGTTVTLGVNYAALAGAKVSNTEAALGQASWFASSCPKVEIYIDPTRPPFDSLGAFKIDDIQSISYKTKKPGAAGDYDFYLVLYTQTDGVDDTTSWYGYRLNAEPYFSRNLNAPANQWNTWSTDEGTNQLTFFDSAKTGNYGFYGQPTLQDLQAGPINWYTYNTNYTNQSIDYGNETVKYISFQTGSGWCSTFTGYLDAIEISLKDGKSLTIDLESFYPETRVDDNADSNWYLTPGHFQTIQAAIDATAPGGTVNVYPGTYNETASGRYLYNNTGPYQFGLFIGQDKPGLTIRGVDENGNPITNYSNVAATITTNATNSFGYSGTFVEADGVTLQGLAFDRNIPGDNKTIEVIGDAFTLKYSKIVVPDGGSVYINDWRFDNNNQTSHVQSYTIEENYFEHGSSLDISSGAGYSGDVAGRVIKNNVFKGEDGVYWALVSFNGTGGVPWFTYPVGGAVIEGNAFSGSTQYIRARGEYREDQFDWQSYWKNNTFDKAAVTLQDANAFVLRSYTYDVEDNGRTYHFINVRRIGGTLQGEVDNAQNGDTVLAKPGIYEEQVVIAKDLTLQGAGETETIIRSPTTLTVFFTTPAENKPIVLVKDGANVTIKDLQVDGAGRGNGNVRFTGIGFYNAGGTVENVTVTGIRDNPFSGAQHGNGIYAYNGDGTSRTLTIRNVTVKDFQKNGITVAGQGLQATIENNTVTGAGPTGTIAQNGIQVSYGASATVRNNTIEDVAYSGLQNAVSSGILVYQAGGSSTVESNTLQGIQANIYLVESSATVSRNSIASPACVGIGCYGILASDPLSARPSPLEDDSNADSTAQRSQALFSVLSTNPLDTVTVQENLIQGSTYDAGESIGLGAYDGYADRDVAFSASGNVITGWNYGVYVGRCEGNGCRSGRLTAFALNHNAITNNTVGMFNENIPLALNAGRNWWGAKSGPQTSSNPGGSGQPVQGQLDYVPWLCDGTDSRPDLIGFQPAATAEACTSQATHLRFVVQPPDPAFTNEPFSVKVRVEDAQGNLAVNYDKSILLSLSDTPVGWSLGGTLALEPNEGYAEFNNVFITKAGEGYRLLAISGILDPGRSNFFKVSDPSADLSLSLSAPASVNAGASLTYTLMVTNHGPKDASALSLRLTLPGGVTFVSALGDGWACAHNAGVVTCNRTALAAGSTSTITVTVTAPNQPGELGASATVSATSPTDPNPANNSASASTTVVIVPPTGGFQIFLPLVSR